MYRHQCLVPNRTLFLDWLSLNKGTNKMFLQHPRMRMINQIEKETS